MRGGGSGEPVGKLCFRRFCGLGLEDAFLDLMTDLRSPKEVQTGGCEGMLSRFHIDAAEAGLSDVGSIVLNARLVPRSSEIKAGTIVDATLAEADAQEGGVGTRSDSQLLPSWPATLFGS